MSQKGELHMRLLSQALCLLDRSIEDSGLADRVYFLRSSNL